MAKEYVEPEEKDLNDNTTDAEIIDDFNPLGEAVNEKEYTKHNVRMNPNDFATDIPEPSFVPPPMNEPLSEDQKTKKPIEPFNPQVNQMSKKDIHDGAEKVADLILSAYRFAWTWADGKLLFDENKVMQMHREGDIDLDLPFDVAPNVTMSMGEFIQEFNLQTKGSLVVTDDFIETVKPPLIRVLEKRGITMTDEQLLMFEFGKHALTMGLVAYQSLQVKKQMLENMKEQTQLLRQGAKRPTPPPPPPPSQPTPQYEYSQPTKEEYDYEEDYNYPEANNGEAPNVNDIVNKMTGASKTPPPQTFTDDGMEEVEQDEKPSVKIITDGVKKSKGRPKKK